MGQITVTRVIEKISRLSKREQLIVLEIGRDAIDSASAFVTYMSESYGFSKSSVWYNLKRMKEKKVLDFASKDEQGKALVLTKSGVHELASLGRAGVKLASFEEYATIPGLPNNQYDGEMNGIGKIGEKVLAPIMIKALGGK